MRTAIANVATGPCTLRKSTMSQMLGRITTSTSPELLCGNPSRLIIIFLRLQISRVESLHIRSELHHSLHLIPSAFRMLKQCLRSKKCPQDEGLFHRPTIPTYKSPTVCADARLDVTIDVYHSSASTRAPTVPSSPFCLDTKRFTTTTISKPHVFLLLKQGPRLSLSTSRKTSSQTN